MAYNAFISRLFIRFIFLLVTLTVTSWFIATTDYFAVIIILLALSTLQTIDIWRTINQSNRLIARFFTAINYEDYSQRFSVDGSNTIFNTPFNTSFNTSFKTSDKDNSFDQLSESMNLVINKLQSSKQLLEQQSLYLQTILQHVETAVIVFDKSGKINLANKAATRLLQTNALTDINQLQSNFNELYKLLLNTQSVQRSLCSCNIYNQPHQLLVDMVEARIEGEPIYIAAIQDIKTELDAKELKAWQDITRVLTHEISNSITPITSLANSCNSLINGDLDDEDLQDLKEAIATIEKRGENLVKFIDNYRKLSNIPKLNTKRVSINELVTQVTQLFKQEFKRNNIHLAIHSKGENLFVMLDSALIEQVLVNLITNAIAALDQNKNTKMLNIHIHSSKGKLKINVEDNGKGILKEAQQRIFVPYYSTKPNGSGIGLSLSRLIMQLHSGSINVNSELGEGSCFTLIF